MQIEDSTKEPKVFQIGIAVDEKFLARWKKATADLKAVNKSLDVPTMARNKLQALMEDIEKYVVDKKSKLLDLSVLNK